MNANSERDYEYRRGPIAVVDTHTSMMECLECGNTWFGMFRHGGGFKRGCWTCAYCGASSKSRYDPKVAAGVTA